MQEGHAADYPGTARALGERRDGRCRSCVRRDAAKVRLSDLLERNSDAAPLQPQIFIVPCTADVDHSGTVDVLDLNAFKAAYLAQSLQADLNDDGLVDLQDAAEFLQAYNGGC
jgi:hypothetical protein